MQTEHFAADEVIIRQGSTGYKLFIIEKGKAKARDEDTNTDLSVMDTGHYFGEGSLLTKKPVSATVIATEDVICRTLEGRLFDSQLGLIHDIMFKRFQVTLIHQIKLFRENFTREDIEEMADHMTTVTYRSGDVILGANTVSHDFFIIQEGEVQEKGTGEGGTEELVVLVGGDYFGHESFLLGQPVQSTYVAVHDVKCSILNFDVASQVLGPVEEILKEHLHARDQFWDAQVRGESQPVAIRMLARKLDFNYQATCLPAPLADRLCTWSLGTCVVPFFALRVVLCPSAARVGARLRQSFRCRSLATSGSLARAILAACFSCAMQRQVHWLLSSRCPSSKFAGTSVAETAVAVVGLVCLFVWLV